MIVIDNAYVATVSGPEYENGHVAIEGNRIASVGAGSAPGSGAATRIDATGCLVTPGLVNTHHHLYQWLTRGLVQDGTLFEWLTTLYPVWARIDAETVHAGAAANLGWLALSGCTTSTDHHYVFPHDGGDLLEAEITAASGLGVRFHPTRGSMDLGQSQGGLPPDEIVEDRDTILSETEVAIDRWHDPSPDAMLRIAVAPCSPFSVTGDLMREAAELARRKGVRLHTHLAETIDEQDFCREKFNRTPAEYVEDLGWLGNDVWLAHCVHLDDAATKRFAATGTGVAHCPTSNGRLGSGSARVRELLDASVPVGMGVDGSASNEANRLVDELQAALMVARLRGGAAALTAREALRMGTLGGARCLGRDVELGSLERGKLADVAVWRVDGLGAAGGVDPVWTLAFGRPPLEWLIVDGEVIVERGELVRADARALAADAARASQKVMQP
jgi:cytosine/adenosine deaminase-related metal-dependent hydrolase